MTKRLAKTALAKAKCLDLLPFIRKRYGTEYCYKLISKSADYRVERDNEIFKIKHLVATKCFNKEYDDNGRPYYSKEGHWQYFIDNNQEPSLFLLSAWDEKQINLLYLWEMNGDEIVNGRSFRNRKSFVISEPMLYKYEEYDIVEEYISIGE